MSPLLERLAAGQPVPEPVAIVVAHPDDETIGLGGRLACFERLTLIHLTDGAPRDEADARRAGFRTPEAYAAARAAELGEALAVLKVRAERRAYAAADQEAIFQLSAILARLVDDLDGKAAVLTHAYEHGHPDHDTAAFAVALACRVLERAAAPAPERLEFASYHLREGHQLFGRFFPDAERPEAVIRLGATELARKQAALACFRTQAPVLASFDPAVERLRRAPDYDFRAPAPPGQAFYDGFGWTMSSAHWRSLAAAVLTRVKHQNRPGAGLLVSRTEHMDGAAGHRDEHTQSSDGGAGLRAGTLGPLPPHAGDQEAACPGGL